MLESKLPLSMNRSLQHNQAKPTQSEPHAYRTDQREGVRSSTLHSRITGASIPLASLVPVSASEVCYPFSSGFPKTTLISHLFSWPAWTGHRRVDCIGSFTPRRIDALASSFHSCGAVNTHTRDRTVKEQIDSSEHTHWFNRCVATTNCRKWVNCYCDGLWASEVITSVGVRPAMPGRLLSSGLELRRGSFRTGCQFCPADIGGEHSTEVFPT